MKWYNKDKTRMIDVSAITSYEYITLGVSTLHFVCGGIECTVHDVVADEIYKMLTSNKEVI